MREALKDYSERLPAPFDMAEIEGAAKDKSPYVVVAIQEVSRRFCPARRVGRWPLAGAQFNTRRQEVGGCVLEHAAHSDQTPWPPPHTHTPARLPSPRRRA